MPKRRSWWFPIPESPDDQEFEALVSIAESPAQSVFHTLNDAEPLAIAQLVNRFGVQDMLDTPRDPDFPASLLYYFGVLTLAGRDTLDKPKLTIPNLVIRKLYVERLQEQVLPHYEDQEQRQQAVERFLRAILNESWNRREHGHPARERNTGILPVLPFHN